MTPDQAPTAETIAAIEADLDRAFALHGAGDASGAAVLCERVLAKMPRHVTALHLKGMIALTQGDAAGAADLLARAAEGNPADAHVHFHYGTALTAQARWDEAMAAYGRCLKIDPQNAYAHNNLGHLLWQRGDNQAALAHFDRAVALRGDAADVLINRAVVRTAVGLLDAALADSDRAAMVAPDLAQAHFQRGHVLTKLHRMAEALTAFERTVALAPAFGPGWNACGLALAALGQWDAAMARYDEAVRRDPQNAEVLLNRGAACAVLKRANAALANYDRAFAIDPATPYLRGVRLRAKMQVCDWQDHAREQGDLANAVARGEKAAPPWDSLALIGSPDLQRQVAATWAKDRAPADAALGPIAARAGRNRIRLGYFSADFYNHATAHLMAELFERHDRATFALIGFSFGPDRNDAMQNRISAAFDEFIDVRGHSDADVAALARAKGIDIAVDLKGYTNEGRPGIFAHRAAPVQVSYLGYPGTMGADYIDYIIADRVLVPDSDRGFFSEKVVRLPYSYQVNDGKRAIAERRFTRAELGLPESGFVFCCFNSTYKITPEIFAVWMRLLARVPGAVLWLFEDNPAAAVNLRKEAAAGGIDAKRLVFAPRLAPPEHLARHSAADLFLDTLPCCAHTTASDALWAGLPVLTCLGEALAGRVSASLLAAMDLDILVTTSLADYESKAFQFATTPALLQEIKAKLAHNRTTSPLFDSTLFARHIEAAYARMIAICDAGRAPEAFDVAP